MVRPNHALHLSVFWGWPTRPGRGRMGRRRPGRVGFV